MAERAECGSWESPVTSDLVAAEALRFYEPRFAGDSILWLEARPAGKGRCVPVRCAPDGEIRDALPPPWNVRTRVHEYGGGAYATAGGAICFSEGKDQRLYCCDRGGVPRPLTPEAPSRYAGLAEDPSRERLLAVCEDHASPGSEPAQSVVAVDLRNPGGRPRTLLSGSDFYSDPRPSPDGRRLCWLQWSHPNMPWDGTELWTADFTADGGLTARRRVAGGDRESIFQPQWSPSGTLHFVSDRNGFWNVWRAQGSGCAPLHEREAEFGLPQWQFGMSTYGFAADGRIVCAYCEAGAWRLGLIDPGGELQPVETPYCQIDGVAVRGGTAVFRAAEPGEASAIVRFNLASGRCEALRKAAELPERLRPYLSPPREVSFEARGGPTVHAFRYEPRNPDFEPLPDERPPLIVRLHGGPTAAASGALSITTQFWTTRGFAVVDVNYGGSTGYGRAYRERLNGQWGVVDVDDAVAVAQHCVRQGLADPRRLIAKGSSAGGYSVLCCLAFRDAFAAGASYYGIGDLQELARATHKFESRYHESLVGPWPQQQALYAARSPLGAADRIAAPTVFFQGSDDPVVPQSQAEAMVEALRARGVPVAYHLFEGEGHGFSAGAAIKRALDEELAFYRAELPRAASGSSA